MLEKSKKFIFDLLFPIECISCKKEGSWLCDSCFLKLKINQAQYCLECKKINETGKFCPKCAKNYEINRVLIAGDYENAILSKLIKDFKYHFAKDISKILGNFLFLFINNIKNLREEIKDFIIIPIPLHKKRLNWRGFNQAEELALKLNEKLNLKINHNLARTTDTKPQANLNEAERLKNVINAFSWTGENLNGKKILLLDDVTTTGSTLNEASKELKKAGAKTVWALVVAKG